MCEPKSSGFRLAVAARAPADDVAGRVDRNIKLRRAHQTHHVLAALPIGVAVSDAADAALWVLAEFRQFAQMFVQARAVDAKLRLSRQPDAIKRERARGSEQTSIEFYDSFRFIFRNP